MGVFSNIYIFENAGKLLLLKQKAFIRSNVHQTTRTCTYLPLHAYDHIVISALNEPMFSQKKKTSPRFKDKIEHTIHLTKLSSAL
jgi:hypothetical protein